MILLNTNVVSEPLRPAPDARVIEWIDARAMQNGGQVSAGAGCSRSPLGRSLTYPHNLGL